MGIVSLDAEAVPAKGCALERKADFANWQPRQDNRILTENLPVLSVSAAGLTGIGHYDRYALPRKPLETPDLSSFTEEELARCCVGRLKQGGGLVIGSASSTVAGGAGETADVIEEHDFGKLVLADGPTGLRLSTEYREGETGAETISIDSMESILRLLEPEQQSAIRAQIAARRKEAMQIADGVCYQYCSAIPIGTALAQAWNPEIAWQCGDIVGEEMERFGVQMWLAPALNIQRNPLCGRNFEYYSEDPLLSGRTAAAITMGVQSHPNCYVTIKHFACNNQETNRFGSNSIVSERALREIYLKGFEICVKEADPKGLMTSYNLINGEHTTSSRELLTTILR